MANGANGANGTLPVIAKVVTQLGFPVVIAGVLLWWVLTKFEGQMHAIVQQMTHNAAAAQHLVDMSTREFDELRQQSAEMKQQTATLHDHLSVLAQINDHEERLVELRTRELEEYLKRQPLGPPTPP
jgi:hypothetical protein